MTLGFPHLPVPIGLFLSVPCIVALWFVLSRVITGPASRTLVQAGAKLRYIVSRKMSWVLVRLGLRTVQVRLRLQLGWIIPAIHVFGGGGAAGH